ncbi:MAG: carboxypeptidase regulatory-like domain-containing protein [Euryarchaeota archaeon]|nr:carboxypeptidase regulatory-like domain-containing protein [Euryarchaeota archaeon]
MRAKALLLVLVLGFVALSGCSGSGSGNDAGGSGGPVTVGPEPVPDAGVLIATVIDDAQNPLEGAMVGIPDLKAEGVTDASGSVTFQNLVPGTYNVLAGKLGFDSAARRVEIRALDTTAVTLVLASIAVQGEPFPLIYGPSGGYFECRAGTFFWTSTCGTVCDVVATGSCVSPPGDTFYPNDKTNFQFPMQNDTWAFVGEMKWSQGSFATSQNLRLSFSFVGRPGTHWWCTGTSGSPVRWEYHLVGENEATCLTPTYCGIRASQGTSGANEVPTLKHKLQTYTNTPFACDETSNPRPLELAYQQKVDFMVTTFQNMLPPEAWTALPDG